MPVHGVCQHLSQLSNGVFLMLSSAYYVVIASNSTVLGQNDDVELVSLIGIVNRGV